MQLVTVLVETNEIIKRNMVKRSDHSKQPAPGTHSSTSQEYADRIFTLSLGHSRTWYSQADALVRNLEVGLPEVAKLSPLFKMAVAQNPSLKILTCLLFFLSLMGSYKSDEPFF